MYRNTTVISPPLKWQSHDNNPLSGSLIVNNSPPSPQNYKNQIKTKLDDLGFKKSQFQRH